MKSFLQQVAEHYLSKGSLGSYVFIFPNRRSMAFFLRELVLAMGRAGNDKPVLAPRMLALSDFFQKLAGRKVTDKTTLILKLYECYSKLNRLAEPLDDFIYWGDAVLADFDDIDKYKVEPKGLFTNITDLKAMEDDLSYMTDEQLKAVSRLAGYFSPEKMAVPSEVKRNFLQVWQILLPLYRSFNKTLADSGMCYEGMLYRNLDEQLRLKSAAQALKAVARDASTCVFVGLNALNECEKGILDSFAKEGLAEFCWDFSGPMITDKSNPASAFMRENLKRYPQAFQPDAEGVGKPHIRVVNVPSAIGQAKLLPQILKDVPENEKGIDFAVVLPDESMLMPVLGSIPPDVTDVNVTMGYPLATSEWNSLMRTVVAMQMHMKKGTSYFYYKQVYDIFSHGIMKAICTPEEAACISEITKAARSYIPAADLRKGELFSLLFSPALADLEAESAEQNAAFAGYLSAVAGAIAGRLTNEFDAIHKECAMHYDHCLTRLTGIAEKSGGAMNIKPRTWVHLLEQLVAMVSVPFEGEPLGGLQVMGPLETRALDFRRIVLMNSNEGVFPRRTVRPSFIPPELRIAFGLPTYEYQDRIWAYYFYRMICRAQEVWMVYDSRTEGLNSGEESRYVKQLRYLYSDFCEFEESVAMAELGNTPIDAVIPKTAEDLEVIAGRNFSASSISSYISCPASFYYSFVKGLSPDTEVNENLNTGMLGTVCHNALQALLCGEEAMKADEDFDKLKQNGQSRRPMPEVTREYLEGWLKREDEIRWKVLSLIRHEVHTPVVEGRDLVSAEIAVKYVTRVIKEDIRLLGGRKSFKVLGVEEHYVHTIAGHKFSGYVDRIDSFEDGTVRIVDYKTGSDKQNQLEPHAEPEKHVKKVFGSTSHENKASLQFYIYDRFLAEARSDKGLRLPPETKRYNSMYPMSQLFTEGVAVYPEDQITGAAICEQLERVVAEIENPIVGFERSGARKQACRYCNFAALCGKAQTSD